MVGAIRHRWKNVTLGAGDWASQAAAAHVGLMSPHADTIGTCGAVDRARGSGVALFAVAPGTIDG